jgi:hypothetical protein
VLRKGHMGMIAKHLLTALAGAATLGLAAGPAAAQMFESITIRNSTGYTISEIYISPSRTNDWEEDVLGRRELSDGDDYSVDFRAAQNTCDWDLKVVYQDGEEAIWPGIDLCEDWHFELFYNARTRDTRLVSTH